MTGEIASSLMQEGIRLLECENDAERALGYFDRALEWRRSFPAEAYGLAACWLNRGDALTRLGGVALALDAYNEAIKVLRAAPPSDDPRFARRLAIAYQNRALLLAGQDGVAALTDAIGVLEQAVTMETCERECLLAFVWLNLANLHAAEGTAAADDAARQTLTLVAGRERHDAAAAAAGLKARHLLCHLVTAKLLDAAMAEDVHDATDLADDGLSLVRYWEEQGVTRFRTVASELFRFGAQVYARYQPHFLHEFIFEQMDPWQSSQAYVESREMQDAVREARRSLAPMPANQYNAPTRVRHPGHSTNGKAS